jgi:nitric oxide dioxygenase
VLRDGDAPLALISGGVGITPTLAMAQAALAAGNRDVIFIHYARNGDVHAFGDVIDGWTAHPRFSAYVVYEQGSHRDGLSGRPRWSSFSNGCRWMRMPISLVPSPSWVL